MLLQGVCPHRPHPSNGAYTRLQRTKTTWYIGEEAAYVCDDGFTLSGSRSSSCLSTGLWSEVVPTCRRSKLHRIFRYFQKLTFQIRTYLIADLVLTIVVVFSSLKLSDSS